MPTFNNENRSNDEPLANLFPGAVIPLPSPTAGLAVDDTYPVTEDTALNVRVPGVLGNDTGLSGAAVLSGPVNGMLAFNSDGSFTYTPNENFSGLDGFTYNASDGTNTYGAKVTLDVSFVNDAPVAGDDAYDNTIGPNFTVAAPGVLGNDGDPDGDALTAVLVGTVPDLAFNSDGSFTYSGPPGTVSFQYNVSDGTLSSAAPATVDLTVNPPANIALTVQEPGGAPVTSYRWLVQEDATYHIDPAAPQNTPLTEQLFLNFHKSSMPVVAQGCSDCTPDVDNAPTGNFPGPEDIDLNGNSTLDTAIPIGDLALDPTKYYYVSVLPNDAGTGGRATPSAARRSCPARRRLP